MRSEAFRAENQRQALALVVNAIAAVDMTKTWGAWGGASDGQRFAFRSKVLRGVSA